jgi:hypothetical protein
VRQYVDAAAPAPPVARPRPAVTESLRAQIAPPVTKPAEPEVTKPMVVTKPPAKVNASAEALKPRGGRPPIGDRAMTGAQRQARYRANIPGPADRVALATVDP